MSGEAAGERWSPAQRAESVLLSIVSLLDDAEISSPANVDASVMYRDDKPAFKARVKQDVELSKKDIPDGFVLPTHESTMPVVEKPVADDFWDDSDAGEIDFDDFDDDAANGSESDQDLNNDSEDDENYDDDEDDEDTERVTKGKEREEDRLDSDMTEPED
jgi:ubiquitin-conjugating enzyme E2 R